MGCKSQNSDLCIIYPTSYNVYKCALTTHLQHREYRLFLFALQHENLNYPDAKKNVMTTIINMSYIRVYLFTHMKASCHIWLRDMQQTLYYIPQKNKGCKTWGFNRTHQILLLGFALKRAGSLVKPRRLNMGHIWNYDLAIMFSEIEVGFVDVL